IPDVGQLVIDQFAAESRLQALPAEWQTDEIETLLREHIDARGLRIGVVGPKLARHFAEIATCQVDSGKPRLMRGRCRALECGACCGRQCAAEERTSRLFDHHQPLTLADLADVGRAVSPENLL